MNLAFSVFEHAMYLSMHFLVQYFVCYNRWDDHFFDIERGVFSLTFQLISTNAMSYQFET